jgi:uncharacterized cupredoxin-like copper-binding protein
MRLYMVGAVILLLPIQACSAAAPLLTGRPLDFTLVDFSIKGVPASAPGGSFVVHVHNDAPVTHEFLVIRTDLPAGSLPLGPDGIRVDEAALSSVGEINDVPAGTTGTLQLDLAPGHYVFFCNLEGHYLGGMHFSLDVTG